MTRVKEMGDLFTDVRSDGYPNSPGFKTGGTSQAAALAMKPRAPNLRDRVLAAITAKPRTPDEVAAEIEESILGIRPRVTELKRLGLIERTGDRRRNASGLEAWVWRRKVTP